MHTFPAFRSCWTPPGLRNFPHPIPKSLVEKSLPFCFYRGASDEPGGTRSDGSFTKFISGMQFYLEDLMSLRGKAWDLVKWKVMKDRLGYTDQEMESFKENPRNDDVITKAPALMNKTIVLEVIESHGCNSQHKIGDKLVFDGAGNLLSKHSPDKICVYAINAAVPLIYAANELFYAGADPNEMRFKRSACIDVGVQCGGWGRIVLELSIQDRN